MPPILPLLILLPAAAALGSLLLSPRWTRRLAFVAATTSALLAWSTLARLDGPTPPSLTDAAHRALEAAAQRHGIDDPQLRRALIELGVDADPETLARHAALLPAAETAWIRARRGADLDAMADAHANLQSARHEAERLQRAFHDSLHHTAPLRRAAASPLAPTIHAAFHHPWIPTLRLDLLLGADALSLSATLLAALLTAATLLWIPPDNATDGALSLLLATATAAFLALDLGLWWLAWVLTLPPTFALWARATDGRTAARALTPPTLGAAALALALAHRAAFDPDAPCWSLLAWIHTPAGEPTLTFALLLAGLAPRLLWLHTAPLQRAPHLVLPLTLDLLLVTSAAVHVLWPLTPDVSRTATPYLAALALPALALAHLRADPLTARRTRAAAVILLGLASATPTGWLGASLEAAAATLSLSLSALASSTPAPRRQLRALGDWSAARLPGLGGFTAVALVAWGLGTSSLPRPLVVLAWISLLATTATTLRQLLLQPPSHSHDPTLPQALGALPLAAALLALGLAPSFVLRVLDPTIRAWLSAP